MSEQQVYAAQVKAAQALEQADRAQTEYARLLDQAPAQLYQRMLPVATRPDQMPELARQVTELLQGVTCAPGDNEPADARLLPGIRTQAAADLLANALATHDEALAYAIAAPDGPMKLAYAKLGISAQARQELFTPILAADPSRSQRVAQVAAASALHRQRHG